MTIFRSRISELSNVDIVLASERGGGGHDKIAAFVKQWRISPAMIRINAKTPAVYEVTKKKICAGVLTCIIPALCFT